MDCSTYIELLSSNSSCCCLWVLILRKTSHLDAFSVYLTIHSYSAYADGTTTDTLAVYHSGSSRTTEWSLSILKRSYQIWTELSHDVLNPARVPLSLANSQTLGTYYCPRMRWADIAFMLIKFLWQFHSFFLENSKDIIERKTYLKWNSFSRLKDQTISSTQRLFGV